ncbi:MAG: hypothetical protein PHT79_09330 [Syntrophomonadaceae bacterium]|nr:hypothetical protein [Syntrophomonadaceae bacterium]MDD4549943.1 hypothetical protein [Syntrophomonadaceae bacterium]
MANKKQSGPDVTHLASDILRNPNSSKIQKQLAGSVLAQSGTDKQTGAEMEDIASKALSSLKYNNDTKTLAASIVSQSNKER